MNKKIIITGKTNIDKIMHTKPQDRLITKSWINKKDLIKQENQYDFLLNIQNDIFFKEKKNILTELKNKLNSYKHQDIKKNRHDETKLITIPETIKKLIDCSMNCHYCKDTCLIMYKKVRHNKQWTLDRLNNDIGHFTDNVVISCLSCNLKKRRMDEEKFKFSKQLIIRKIK
tara:strand:- start:609 stop:1124 length:516 start_codon:yes stop_codon:yes gene_type:complete